MSKDKKTSEQAKRFAEAAARLDCDESESAFERQLQKVAVARPKKNEKDAKKGE